MKPLVPCLQHLLEFWQIFFPEPKTTCIFPCGWEWNIILLWKGISLFLDFWLKENLRLNFSAPRHPPNICILMSGLPRDNHRLHGLLRTAILRRATRMHPVLKLALQETQTRNILRQFLLVMIVVWTTDSTEYYHAMCRLATLLQTILMPTDLQWWAQREGRSKKRTFSRHFCQVIEQVPPLCARVQSSMTSVSFSAETFQTCKRVADTVKVCLYT